MALPVPTNSDPSQSSADTAQPLAAALLSTAAVHPQQYSHARERLRRKVSDLDLSSGPVEYMKELRSSLTNADGTPTMEREDDPTTVWGLVDKG